MEKKKLSADSHNNMLLLAMEVNDYGMVEFLVENGINVNVKYKDSPASILYYAIVNKQTKIAKLLIENGADITELNDQKQTLLHLAAKSGQIDVVKLLIEKGADVNAVDTHGRTPLHEAVCLSDAQLPLFELEEFIQNKTKISKLLIKKGANVNAVAWGFSNTLDISDYTPLDETNCWGALLAFKSVNERGYRETTRLLLEHGAKSGLIHKLLRKKPDLSK